MDENILWIVVLAGIVLAAFLYVQIREKINLKRAGKGEDRERLRQAVAAALQNESGYQVAYAHWEKVEHFGRTTRTTYYCYALAFDAARMWVIPLRFRDGGIQTNDPILLTGETLGIVNAHVFMKKDGVRRVSVTLYDKAGKSFADFYVDAVNTREDKYHHMNLLQGLECEQFGQFITALSAQVEQDNKELKTHVVSGDVAARSKRATIQGVIGLVCFFLPIISVIIGGLGLLTAPKPSETGGKPKAPLILCALSLVVGVLGLIGTVLLICLT